MFFLNPFRNHEISDFPDTHIDLIYAEHRNSIALTRRQLATQASNDKVNDDHSSSKESDAHSGRGDTSIRADTARGLTLAELREEIDLDVSANDTPSLYDSKSRK